MITDVQVLRYELAFRVPIRAGDGVHETRSGLLLGLVEETGHVGWGEAAPLPGWSRDTFPQAEVALRGLAETIQQRPRPAARLRATASAWLARVPSAAAALDVALLDLAAQRSDVSMARHVAGGREPAEFVPVNALIAGDSPDEVSAAGAHALEERFTTFKLKLGEATIQKDIARVRALRQAVGGDSAIRLDAGGRWSLEEASEAMRHMESEDIEYIEDPVGDLDSLVQLAMATEVPLAADALLIHSGDPLGTVSSAVADVFVLKPGALGGLTVAAGIAELAMQRGKRVVVTSFLDTAVGLTAALHLAAALPGKPSASGLATSYLLAQNVAEPPPIESGSMRVPQVAGLGIAPTLMPHDTADGEGSI